MARSSFKRDSAGLARILKSAEVHRMVHAATEEIAGNASAALAGEADVDSIIVTTDRAHGIVAIQDPRGVAIEGRTGALHQAAAESGLSVRSRRRG